MNIISKSLLFFGLFFLLIKSNAIAETKLFKKVSTKQFQKHNFLLGTANDNSKVKFQQALFACLLGYSDGDFAMSYGLSYAPRIGFIINDEFSVNMGTNIHLMMPSGAFEGIGGSIPILVGFAYGAPASHDSENDFGLAFNMGLSKVLIEDSPEIIDFMGPTAEIGFSFMKMGQIRLSGVTSFDNFGSEFFFSGGFGFDF